MFPVSTFYGLEKILPCDTALPPIEEKESKKIIRRKRNKKKYNRSIDLLRLQNDLMFYIGFFHVGRSSTK